MKGKKEPWYAAKCIYKINDPALIKNDKKYLYEERIILVRAKNYDQAIQIAEKEAIRYANKNSEYTGFINVFHLYDSIIDNKTEVYSIMRSSNLEESEYLDRFYDTGDEHTKA